MSDVKLGDKNPMWKGDQVSYTSLHEYVRKHLPVPERCEVCHEVKSLDLANISQKYKRDLSDWEYLCRRCHMIKDGRLDKIIANVQSRKNRVTIKCKYCGKEDVKQASTVKRGQGKYCTKSCSNRGRKLDKSLNN